MNSILVEAIPALSFRVLRVALAEHRSLVVEDIVLSWHEENLFVGALQNLVYVIELLGLGEMTDVTGVQKELGLSGKSIDLIHSGFQCCDHVGIGWFIESHVAVADLYEAQLSHFVRLHG